MFVLLSLLAADAVATVRIPAAGLALEDRAPLRRSPYRLDPNVAGPADGKAAAVAVTGKRCAVVGQPLCTRKPRTLYSASY